LLSVFPLSLNVREDFLPLLYHTWSFVVTQGIVVLKSIDSTKMQKLIDQMYNGRQDKFENHILLNTYFDDALQVLAKYLSNTPGIESRSFIHKYQDSTISSDTIIEFENLPLILWQEHQHYL
jgi:hypothetical protein